MDLTADKLKLEEQLENTINSEIDINQKTQSIKTLLSQIVITENSLIKFHNMMNYSDNENKINTKDDEK